MQVRPKQILMVNRFLQNQAFKYTELSLLQVFAQNQRIAARSILLMIV